MIGGIFIQNKRYTLLDFIAVVLMTSGLIFFTIADQSVSPKFDMTGVSTRAQGSKSANFFRSGAERWSGSRKNQWSGAVERFSRKKLERSGAVERKFQKISIFLVFFMNFSRIIAQKGPKRSQITPHALARCLGTFLKNIKCNTRYVSKNLSGAEYQKIGGAERSAPVPPLRSAQIPLHRSTDFEPCSCPLYLI
jgi:hypothetical protein